MKERLLHFLSPFTATLLSGLLFDSYLNEYTSSNMIRFILFMIVYLIIYYGLNYLSKLIISFLKSKQI